MSQQLWHPEGAQLQDTIGQGKQQSLELEPIENAEKLDRQNGMIQSGISAGQRGDRGDRLLPLGRQQH